MSHLGEQIDFEGTIHGKNSKDLKLLFNKVALEKITPEIDSLKLGGRIDGKLQLQQIAGQYRPTSNLTISDLLINRKNLGDLTLLADGNEDLSKFQDLAIP